MEAGVRAGLWCVAALGPTIIAGALELRAALTRKSESWADYASAVTVLWWCMTPVIVVAAPLLAGQPGWSDLAAALVSVAAMLLFCTVSTAFVPNDKYSLLLHLKRTIAGMGASLGIGGYLVYLGFTGELQSLAPSGRLFFTLLWVGLAGEMAAAWLTDHDPEPKPLGPGELLDRVQEIARRRGADLKGILVRENDLDVCACAAEGTQIVLSDGIVRNLNKSEVDAVVEHEVGHITDERIWTLDRALHYGCYLAILALALLAERHTRAMQAPWSSLVYVVWVAMFVVPNVLAAWYSRATERRANESMGRLTDSLSAISALYKTTVLNHYPVSRSWWSRVVSTHPCADEVIAAIASRAGLSDDQVEQACRRADEEIRAGSGERYHLALAPEPARKAEVDLVKRPGRWAGCGARLLGFAGAAACICACFAVLIAAPEGSPAWVPVVIGFVAAMLAAVVPIVMAERARLRRLNKQVEERLAAEYGADTASRFLVVDAMFPESEGWDQPWQGALLGVSGGELVILGEANSLRMPPESKINVSRRLDHDLEGSEARMVMITCKDNEALRTVMVRVLGRPQQGEPANWRALEKRINDLLASAGASTVPLKEIMPAQRGRPVWSIRIPIAAAIAVAVAVLAGHVKQAVGEDSRAVDFTLWLLMAAIVAPALVGWIKRVHQPDPDEEK